MNKLLLVLFIIVICLSCSKKNSPAPKPTLTGKWNMVSDTGFLILKDFFDSGVPGIPIPIPHPSYFQFNNDGTGAVVANEDPQATVRHFDYDIQRDTLIELNYRAETISGVNYTAAKDSAVIVQISANKLTLGFYGFYGDPNYQTERAYFTK